ncbi:45224_t:CDS:2 [Gigaspora margarita]|uniref:45224_t:CDS:1 n=1 Tax=Gigaspora margarita TaxID=4874 RepID=A0ABN7VYF6_GIGMA|nr:45224_t:CDS:2 [Gigaspora margarita]
MQIVLDEIRPPIFEEWFDELRLPILKNSETCYIHDEKNEEFIYYIENHPDLINEYNTKSTSTDKFLNIDDLIIEYNSKPTSSEKLFILINTKEMSLAKNSDILCTFE